MDTGRKLRTPGWEREVFISHGTASSLSAMLPCPSCPRTPQGQDLEQLITDVTFSILLSPSHLGLETLLYQMSDHSS